VNFARPNYWYLKDGQVHSRLQFQKHKLAKKLIDFDPNLSEKENMQRNGYKKLQDCGNMVFVWKK